MTTTLEQQMLDLCRKHDLTSISLHAYRTENAGEFVGVNVHAEYALGHASGRDTSMGEVFEAALRDLRAKQMIGAPELVAMRIEAADHE